jgi:hypothetical protein
MECVSQDSSCSESGCEAGTSQKHIASASLFGLYTCRDICVFLYSGTDTRTRHACNLVYGFFFLFKLKLVQKCN